MIFCFVLAAHASHAATQLKKLGTHPFHKITLLKAEDIYPTLMKSRDEAKTGFINAGAIALFEPFMAQAKSTTLEPTMVHPGETLVWMMFKKKGKPVIINDVTWTGQKPFQAFRVMVRHKGSDYEFIIPEICFNISLKGISDAPAPAPTPPPPAPAPTPVPAPAPAPKPEAAAKPADGMKKQPAPAAAPTKPAAADDAHLGKKGRIVGDTGLYRQPDPATFAFFRVGYMHQINDKMGVTGLVGFAPLLEGCEDNPAKLADVLFTYDLAPSFFLGAGVGIWHTSFKTRTDLLLEAGHYLTKDLKGPNFALFFEVRSAFDQMDEIEDFGRFGLGFRIYY